MNNLQSIHRKLSAIRAGAFSELFGAKPIEVYPFHRFSKNADPFLIDMLVYPLDVEGGEDGSTVAVVTNGMSDLRLCDADNPREFVRHELIQYVPKCTEARARHIHEMAWLPLFDKFLLDVGDSIAWPSAGEECSPWKNGFFLRPIWSAHRDFEVVLDGDPMSLLWLIPLSDEELAYKQAKGLDALVERMEAVDLPWVFDSLHRPSLV